jgi:hypothetical protein
MKVSWGTKIAVFYIAFVVFTLGMVYMAFNQNFDLVTEDYYAQEIKYQQKINDTERAMNLDKDLKIDITGSQLNIVFPNSAESIASGTINCFRPSDETKDFDVQIAANSNTQSIQLDKFIKGKYVLKMDWIADDKSYYEERTIIIP